MTLTDAVLIYEHLLKNGDEFCYAPNGEIITREDCTSILFPRECELEPLYN